MKILYYFMVVCFVLTFGCTGMKAGRTVLQDNIFYSSTLPRIKMKVSSDFKYIGKAEKQRHVDQRYANGSAFVECESFLFGHIEDGKILRAVSIEILTIQRDWHWLPDLFGWIKNKLDEGVVKIQGKSYQYVVAASSKAFPGYVEHFIHDRGYIIPNCFIAKGFGTRTGADHRVKMQVFYAEEISYMRDRKYSCADWQNKNMLTNEQREFLKKFVDRSEKNIEVF